MAQYQRKQELIHFSPCLLFRKMQVSLGRIKGAGLILSQLGEEITRSKVQQVKPNDKKPSTRVLLDLIYCCNDLFELHVLTTPICMPNNAENNPALFFWGGKSVFLWVSFICRFLFKISADGLFSF